MGCTIQEDTLCPNGELQCGSCGCIRTEDGIHTRELNLPLIGG